MFHRRMAGGALALLTALAWPAAPASAAVPSPSAPPTGPIGPDVIHAATVGAASISAGKNHSCAITSLGAVYCWGDNSAGQLGDGRVPQDSSTAVAVTGDLRSTAVQVDAGDAHTCAIDYDGLAYCWGANGDGQLGIASTTDAAVPAELDSLADRTLVEITTGANHTCAIDDEGAAWCWGDNSAGQIGVPGLAPGTTVPVRVSTAGGMTDPVVDIAAGGDTTCAITDAGAAWCWGEGDDGQIGDGAMTDRDEPKRVSINDRIRQIAVGGAQACGVDEDGRAHCWGETSRGTSSIPASVNGIRFAQVTAGARHVCGLSDDDASCWGSDVNGQLGDGSTTHADDPVQVHDLDGGLRDIEAGARHSCALDTSGVAWCWGANDEGQLGSGGTAASTVPVTVRGLPRPPGAVTGVTVTALDGGLRVSWRPPADFGTGAFVSYVGATTFFEAGCEVTTATATSCDLHGLANGAKYDVFVLTTTPVGRSVSASASGTPVASRNPPTLAPGDGGGLPLTGANPVLLCAAGCALIGLGGAALLVSPGVSRRRALRHRRPRRGIARRPA